MKQLTNPQWKRYVVQTVTRVQVELDDRTITSIDTYLLFADSQEQAIKKAKALYLDDDYAYRNSEGNVVATTCLGLNYITVIQSKELTDGEHLSSFSIVEGRPYFAEQFVIPEEHLFEVDVRNDDYPNIGS